MEHGKKVHLYYGCQEKSYYKIQPSFQDGRVCLRATPKKWLALIIASGVSEKDFWFSCDQDGVIINEKEDGFLKRSMEKSGFIHFVRRRDFAKTKKLFLLESKRPVEISDVFEYGNLWNEFTKLISKRKISIKPFTL